MEIYLEKREKLKEKPKDEAKLGFWQDFYRLYVFIQLYQGERLE